MSEQRLTIGFTEFTFRVIDRPPRAFLMVFHRATKTGQYLSAKGRWVDINEAALLPDDAGIPLDPNGAQAMERYLAPLRGRVGQEVRSWVLSFMTPQWAIVSPQAVQQAVALNTMLQQIARQQIVAPGPGTRVEYIGADFASAQDRAMGQMVVIGPEPPSKRDRIQRAIDALRGR